MIKKVGQYLLLASLALMVGLVFYKYGTIFCPGIRGDFASMLGHETHL